MARLSNYFFYGTIGICTGLVVIYNWPQNNDQSMRKIQVRNSEYYEAQLKALQKQIEANQNQIARNTPQNLIIPQPHLPQQPQEVHQPQAQQQESKPVIAKEIKIEVPKEEFNIKPNLPFGKELKESDKQELTQQIKQGEQQQVQQQAATEAMKSGGQVTVTAGQIQAGVQLGNETGQEEEGTKCGEELMSMPMYVNQTLIKYGEGFSCELMKYLDENKLSGFSTEEVKEFKSEEVVYVTYSSSNHFDESKLALLTLRNISKNKIIYYDIGLTTEQASELKTVCNLEYRKFDFGHYPSFVKHLMTYSFKPILIAEVYKEHPVFWFIDASVHFSDAEKLETFYRDSSNNRYGKFIGRSPSGHSIYAATNPKMYDYLPIDDELKKKAKMFSAWMFVLRSPLSREAVKWNFLCALTQNCIAPPGSQLGCHFGSNWFSDFANCHRYDQSSINIVLNNLFEKYGNHPTTNGSEFGEFFKVERTYYHRGALNLECKNTSTAINN